jgi:5-formyltetrahydrofolate cyclo-ligase
MDRNAGRGTEKVDLRAMMVARRRAIPEKSRIEMDLAVASHLFTLPEVICADHIHLYLSISAFAEVDTAFIVDGLTVMQKRLSVPVVRDGELLSALYHKGDLLRTAQFGQPEPEVCSVVDESDLELVLLPLLAFDSRGYRLGYGKGLYDRFLQRLSKQGVHPFRVGLSYLQQRVDTLPVDPWDEPLDAVVYEDGCIRFT